MAELLKYSQASLAKSQLAMKAQANMYRKQVEYDKGDKVWLSSQNIRTTRPFKSLEDR